MSETETGIERLWDSVGEIFSKRLPYWLRKPKRPPLLNPPDFTAHRDRETLSLFKGET